MVTRVPCAQPLQAAPAAAQQLSGEAAARYGTSPGDRATAPPPARTLETQKVAGAKGFSGVL